MVGVGVCGEGAGGGEYGCLVMVEGEGLSEGGE